MSNNLVPQPLSLLTAPPVKNQYELTPSNPDSSRPSQMANTGPISNSLSLQSHALYSQPMNLSFPMSRGAESLGIPMQKLNGQVDLQVAASAPPFFDSPMNLVGGMGAMANNMAVQQQLASLNKRKVPMDSISSSTSRMSPASNKRHMQTEHRPWLQQMAASNRMNMPGESLLKMTVSKHTLMQQNKKQSPLESIPAKSVQQRRLLSPKTQISPKTTSELFESVRSKMRESLASALALVTQEDGRSPNDGKNSERDVSTSFDQLKGAQFSVSISNHPGDGGDAL
ncbi:hypothetical protein MLD38_015217 [Melastoma candidum]|uniref:Uncharacterized protein n=1 Tax=Melastoma candidum TaxID=119954 RepID=A0ACB9RFF2_9MYRT|nr:hypothetical protein MLD38_015217 [Melastoma candidum]